MSLNFWWAELKEGFEVGGPGSGCIDSRSGTVSLACLDCSRVIVSFVPAWLGQRVRPGDPASWTPHAGVAKVGLLFFPPVLQNRFWRLLGEGFKAGHWDGLLQGEAFIRKVFTDRNSMGEPMRRVQTPALRQTVAGAPRSGGRGSQGRKGCSFLTFQRVGGFTAQVCSPAGFLGSRQGREWGAGCVTLRTPLR